jgi:uncharacterized membrane protein
MSEYIEHEESASVDEWESIQVVNRPKWPVVIGIISIIWGGLWLLCGGLGLAFLPFSASLVEPALEGDPLPYGMVPTATDYIIGTIGIIGSLLLLFAGIMAVSRRPLTRPLHLVYGIIAIPLSLWSYMNQMSKAALNAEWAKEFPDNPMAAGMSADSGQVAVGQIVGLVMTILLGVCIPLFYLIWFGLIKTKPEQVTGGDEGVY